MPKNMEVIFIDMLGRSLLKKIISIDGSVRFCNVDIPLPPACNIILQNNKIQTSTTLPQLLLLPRS